MVIARSLGELVVDQILRYYQIVLNINERDFIHIGKKYVYIKVFCNLLEALHKLFCCIVFY